MANVKFAAATFIRNAVTGPAVICWIARYVSKVIAYLIATKRTVKNVTMVIVGFAVIENMRRAAAVSAMIFERISAVLILVALIFVKMRKYVAMAVAAIRWIVRYVLKVIAYLIATKKTVKNV
ncbi:MAG: hypothetical protein WCZ89_07510 [Phycisphaerae bacterium]